MIRLTHARILEQWGERKKWSRKGGKKQIEKTASPRKDRENEVEKTK